MKLQDFVHYVSPVLVALMIAALEHEKSFLMQDDASIVWSIAIHQDSLLLTSSNDIVQKDIQTGAIQRTFRAHKKAIISFVVTNDARMITSAYDDMVIVWDLEAGSILKRISLRSSDTLVRSLSFKDDKVFAGGLDEKIRQVDLITGRVVRTISLNSNIFSVAVGSDSIYVGKELSPNLVKLNIENGAIVQSFNGHSSAVLSLFLNDSLLFSGSADRTIICWNSASGEIVRQYVGHSGFVYAVAVFDDELYSSASTASIFKWSINDGQIIKKFPPAHTNEIPSLAYRSHTLFTGSHDTTIIKWDAGSGMVLSRYAGKNSKLRSVVSWKNLIISAGEDKEIRLWDASIDSIEPFAVIGNNLASIYALLVFEDLIYSGDYYAYVKALSLTNFTLIKSYRAPGGVILALAANKISVYGANTLGSIYQWNISSGIQRSLANVHSFQIRSLQLNDDVLYSGSWDFAIKAWDTKSLEMMAVFKALKEVYAILIQQENLIAGTSGSLEIFSLVSGEKTVMLAETSACNCMAMRANIVYTGHDDSLIRVRDSYSLVSYETYAGHSDSVYALCLDEVFNLYSTGFDGTIKKWNIASRSVAFSFENKTSSVSSLTVHQNQLFVGLKSGRIDCYNNSNAMSVESLGYHSKAISSLILFNDSIYSSSIDGTIQRYSLTGDRNVTMVYKSNFEPMRDLFVSSFLWVALQGDAKIVYSSMRMTFGSVKVFDSQMPLISVAATKSVILAGSKSGVIYAWGINSMQKAFELKGHISIVNSLLVVDDRLFSASDDKTIIEWSLNSKTASKTYKRLSSSALGHLGSVNALSYCSDTLFSAGSDLTVRRWETTNGKHNDVYFGFTKAATSVLCYNGSVFAGSDDLSVLMFQPSLPQTQDVKESTTTASKKTKGQKRIVRLRMSEGLSMNVSPIFISGFIILVVIIIVIGAIVFLKKQLRKTSSPPETSATILRTETTLNAINLETVVNSVMGISKHAAFLIESSVLAKTKRLAAGGGGELFLAKIMDSSLRKKFGEIVIQKIVFVKNKSSEESFYQEVGIMILLNSFPHFCTILGYTERPPSIVMKYYPDGSLYEWIRKNKMTKTSALKIMKEISEALNTMHSYFLAHCDMKTQNVLVQVENSIPSCFLTDFGITQVLSESIIAAKSFNVINLRGLSVPFASPEAFIGFRTKNYDKINFKMFDIYSFGCLAYEVMERKAPWY